VFGTNLADNVYQGSQVYSNGRFLNSVAGIAVSVDGVNAPLTYVGPTQINFQVPWGTPIGPAVNVQVMRAGAIGNVQQIAIASAAAPSVFLYNYAADVAWVTGGIPAEGCSQSQCAVEVGDVYTLWANGLGPKTQTEQDGVPSPGGAVSVIGGTASCHLTIEGIVATVSYCGAAPGEIIDQVNFTCPVGIPPGAPVAAQLTIGGASGTFMLPSPASAPAGE